MSTMLLSFDTHISFDTHALRRTCGAVLAFVLLIIALLAVPQALAQTTYTVTVENKTSDHPYNNQGWPEGFAINGDQGMELTLQRGVTYTFEMNNVGEIHAFYISTSAVGAGAGEYNEGVEGNRANGNETLTFTPSAETPDLLYYQCYTAAHGYMGYRLNVIGSAPSADIRLDTVATGLTSPVTLAEAPDGTERLFIVDQAGEIRILMPDGTLLEEPFLDLSEEIVDQNPGFDERGVLGLAFHPEYATNGRFFVYYSAPLRASAPDGYNHTATISEFQVSGTDPNQADPDSETILLEVNEPQGNHNGGTLAFGPDDGYLYISLGDGGGADDTGTGHVSDWYAENDGGNGQDVTENLLGNVLRIDVDTGDPYGIPSDNPFVDMDGLDEIYAYGFRNPYRMSFDMGGENRLFVADAGQNLWEEISIATNGGNFGWNVREGTHCFDAANPSDPQISSCPGVVGSGHPAEGDPLIDPVIEYANAAQEDGLGVTTVGGHVYRGSRIPDFEGRFIFGDFSESFNPANGSIFISEESSDGLWSIEELVIENTENGEVGMYLLGLGQDLSGEMYALTSDSTGPVGTSGIVFAIQPPSGSIASEPAPGVPSGITLTNHPNPFSESTTIRYALPRAQQVRLDVYDVLGRRVTTLVDGRRPAGPSELEYRPADLPSGVYFYRLTVGSTVETRSFVIMNR